MTTQKTITEALSNPDLTAAGLGALLKQVSSREAEVHQRIAQIRPVTGASDEGPERAACKMSGTPAELRALDDEHTDLILEREQLTYQRQTLQSRREAAQMAEAAEGLPDMLDGMESRLAALETARDEFARQLSEFNGHYAAVAKARVMAERGGHSAPTAKSEIVDRIAALAPWAGQLRLRVFSRQCDHRLDLGLDQPHNHLRAS